MNFVVEQTGYPPEVVELDADLEADLGIDSIKKAQLFGELQEYFDVKPSENLSLDDFPTLRHVLDFLRNAPVKAELAAAQPTGSRGEEAASPALTAAPPRVHVRERSQHTSTDVKPDDVAEPTALNVVELRGTPYEMGIQHGLSKRKEIHAILRRYADLAGPALENLPRLDRALFVRDVLCGPDELDEMQGIADAVQVPLGNIVAHNMAQFPDAGAGCSHFAVTARRNAAGTMIHAANEDLPLALSLRDCLARVVQVRHPTRGILHLTFSVAGTVGGINGINACGLAVTSSMLLDRPCRSATEHGRLHSLVVKAILEGAHNIESALEILGKLEKRGAWGLCLSHYPSDRLCYVEYDGQTLQTRDVDDAVAATNHGLLLSPIAEVPDHSRHRLNSLEELLGQRSKAGLTVAASQAVLRSRYDPGRGRDTPHRTMNTLCRVDNQVSIVMVAGNGQVWVTSDPGSNGSSDRFDCLPIGKLLPPQRAPIAAPTTAEMRGPEGTLPGDDGDAARQGDDARVARRFVMRMVDAPLDPGVPESPVWRGPVLIVGRNRSAEALRARLEASGATVREVPLLDELDETLAAFDRLWHEGPAPHLFLMTGRDGEATHPYDEAAWHRRRERGVLLPFFICQRWIARASEARLLDKCTLVAATAMGGDFGFSGRLTAVEGGALTGLVKGVYIELAVMREHRGLLSKAIDAPIDEPPEALAAAICRELAAGTRDYEVACVGGKRRLQRAVPEEAAIEGRAAIRPGGTWVVTGGARGITAACALELGRRYGLTLHLIGSSPPPQIDPAWRDLSDDGLKALRSSVVLQARQRGQSPEAEWSRVEKAIEIDRSLRAFAAARVHATYYACDVSDRPALAEVLQRIRRTDGPIEGVLHGAGVQRACRFERKNQEDVRATIGAKVDGARHLMALTRQDPIRFFVGFGSVAGRLGGNGQTDYCAASDMLCKLIDWYRTERPSCRAVGFHWSAWDEVGMAAQPAMRVTLQMVNRQFIPRREGIRHLLRELDAGAPEREVMIVDWDYYRKFYRDDTPTHRYVLRMFDEPLPGDGAPALHIDGPVLILGDNPAAAALSKRLGSRGVEVFSLPVHEDADASIAALERLWASHPAKHLFLLTARDEDACLADQRAWQRRRARGILTPYLVTQRWFQLLSDLPDHGGATLVAVTALGSDFGLSGSLTAPEGGALTGLLKSLYIEDTRKPQRELRVKAIDAAAGEPPDALADAILRELAADRPEIEVGWSRGRRQVVRPVLEPVDQIPRRDPAIGGTWVVTGGGTGITALVAFELGRRYGLKLHLIGRSPHPRDDALWRHFSDAQLKDLKASLTREAIAAGRTPDEQWKAIAGDVEIQTNLRKLAAAGVKATYHVCDVSDWDALAALLDQVRREDGPIEGIIHGAGYGNLLRFEKNTREKLAQSFDSKVAGAVALMALTRNDPLRFFIGFGSLSGRLGGNGLTDYAAANDMLAKLIDWFRRERPDCASACFHWESWAGVGMAMRPKNLVGAKGVLKLDFMSPREGIDHLHNEVRAGLPEGEVLVTNGQFYRMFYPHESPVTSPRPEPDRAPRHPADLPPLIDAVRPADRGRGLVAEVRLDPRSDVFLDAHRLRGKPILPGVIGVEALAEAATLLGGDRTVVAVSDVEFVNGLVCHNDCPTIARVSVIPAEGGARCLLSSDFRDRHGRLVEQDRPHVRGLVELADRPVSFSTARPDEPIDWHPSRYREDDLLHHGPSLRCLKAYAHQQGIGWGKILAPAMAELAGSRPASGWIIPAAVLDACLVACGHYLFLEFPGGVELPKRFDRLRLGRLPREGETCLVRLQLRERTDGHSRFDFTLFGEDDEVLLRAEGYETVMVSQGAS